MPSTIALFALTAACSTSGEPEEATDALEVACPDLEANKGIVVAFYTLAFDEHQPAEAVARYVGPHYIQHNPLIADGPEAFVAFATAFGAAFPQSSLEVKSVLAEGDRVLTHSLLKTSPMDRGTVAMDLWRLENGKIVEHWDVLQPFPASSANDHPMF